MNKTRKIEMTVELIRILVAVGIAYAIALVTLFLISEDPVYIIQQFVLGPFSSVRRVGSIINQAIPFVHRPVLLLYVCGEQVQSGRRGNLHVCRLYVHAGGGESGRGASLPADGSHPHGGGRYHRHRDDRHPGAFRRQVQGQHRGGIPDAQQHSGLPLHLGSEISDEDPSIGAMGSYPLPDNAVLPNIFGKFRIQSGLFFAIIAVILVAILFYKMVFGYKMRVVGSNPLLQRPAAST